MIEEYPEEIWNEQILTGWQFEFDWFAIDEGDRLGMFSSFNTGYIPKIVKKSRTTYNQLFAAIEQLESQFVGIVNNTKGESNGWVEYSERGFYAFDFQDVHRKIKLDQYDLISMPKGDVRLRNLNLKSELVELLPRFDLSFDAPKLKVEALKKALNNSC